MAHRHLLLGSSLLVALALGACETHIGGGRTEGDEPAFEVARDRIVLLPFRVRLARLAQVAGVTADSPVLESVRTNAAALGDHDFASGTPASDQWTASRMSLWVKALEPVCASTELRARFPGLPASSGDLIAAAWGREATEEDLAGIAEALEPLGLDAEESYQAACLSILSALEFVAR